QSNTSSSKANALLPRRRGDRYIPTQIKKEVWIKSKGQCCYKDPKTGRICGSRKFLEVDHKEAYSRGGASTVENLQLLCSAHNAWKGTRRIQVHRSMNT